MAVTEDDTDLRGSGTLLGQLGDVLDNLVGGGLEPRWGSARVGDGGGGNTLALGVKATHDEVVRRRGGWSEVVEVDEEKIEVQRRESVEWRLCDVCGHVPALSLSWLDRPEFPTFFFR